MAKSFNGDFAGSVVVHAMGGGLPCQRCSLLGAHYGRYTKDGRISAHPPHPFHFHFALGAWILTVGWFGFNVVTRKPSTKFQDWCV